MGVCVVTIVSREVKSEGGKSFTSYSGLSSTGKWYRLSNIDGDKLKQFDKKVAHLEVSRLFYKDLVNKNGEQVHFPTLVVESVSTPTAGEKDKYDKELDALNAKTLADFH